MLKLLEAAQRVTRTKENEGCVPNFEEAIADQFDIDDLEQSWDWWQSNAEHFRTRLKGYWLNKWEDSDTHCGRVAYFLDDKLVLVAIQMSGRSSDPGLSFVDAEAHKAFSDFIDLFRTINKKEPTFLSDEDEIGEDVVFNHHADTVINSKAIYQGREIGIRRLNYMDRKRLDIQHAYGERRLWKLEEGQEDVLISMDDITIKLHIDGHC